MIIIPLQYDGHRGPDAVGQHKLTFTIDESVTTEFNPMSIKKGAQFLVMMIPVDDGGELSEFQSETKEDTENRFRKMMEATIGDIAEIKGIDREEYRKEVKEKLRHDGLIKSSTKELSLEGLGKVIVRLKEHKHELQHRPK